MSRDSMVFYRSFYEAVKKLPPEQYKETLNALFAYAMDGEITELSVIPDALFTAFKPQIDANNRRYENGCKGGRPITKAKPKNNQTVTKPYPNENDNENDNDNEIHKHKSKNKFCDYPQSETDFDALERKVFING